MKRITSVNITFSTGDHFIGPGGHVDIEDSAISDGILTLEKNKRIIISTIADLPVAKSNEPKKAIQVPSPSDLKPIFAEPPILSKPVNPEAKSYLIDSPEEADKYLNQNKSTTMRMLKKEQFTLHDLNLLHEQETKTRKRKPVLALIKELMVS